MAAWRTSNTRQCMGTDGHVVHLDRRSNPEKELAFSKYSPSVFGNGAIFTLVATEAAVSRLRPRRIEARVTVKSRDLSPTTAVPKTGTHTLANRREIDPTPLRNHPSNLWCSRVRYGSI